MSGNPYAAFVAGRDPAPLVREFPGRLVTMVDRLGAGAMGRRLAPGKWTVAEILCHLADTEIAFSFRWRQALALDHHVVQPFDQDLWAKHYPSTPGIEALHVFLALRQWNCLLLDRVPAADWERKVSHPERGEMTFRTMVEMMAGHDLNHLGQLDQMERMNPSGERQAGVLEVDRSAG